MELDLIIPAHNEEHRIGTMLGSYRSEFADPGVRFIVALDSCQDSTATVVGRHAEEDPRVEVRVYPKLGKGGVILETFSHCQAEMVAFVDADGATPPGELRRLVEAARHNDGAIASRRQPGSVTRGRRTWGRILMSTVFALVVRALFRLPYRDTQCGAKVIRSEALERILPLLTVRGLAFDVELLVVAHRLGYRLTEVPTVWVEQPGSRLRLLRDTRQTARSLLELWIDHRLQPLAGLSETGGSLWEEHGAA